MYLWLFEPIWEYSYGYAAIIAPTIEAAAKLLYEEYKKTECDKDLSLEPIYQVLENDTILIVEADKRPPHLPNLMKWEFIDKVEVAKKEPRVIRYWQTEA